MKIPRTGWTLARCRMKRLDRPSGFGYDQATQWLTSAETA